MADEGREVAHHIGRRRFHIADVTVQELVKARRDEGEIRRADRQLQGGQPRRR